MAIIKAVNSKANIGKAVDYVTKEEKTEEKLISGKDCIPQTAKQEMQFTKEQWGKTTGRQYKHYVQSFNPKDKITPKKAHEIGREFAENEKFKGHEVLIATHIDKGHIHNHFIINSVNFENGNKYQETKKDLELLKEKSNELSKENNLTIPTKGDKITSYNQKKYKVIEKDIKGEGRSAILQTGDDIKSTLEKATSKEEFIKTMEGKGYKVEWKDTRKHITFTTPDGRKFRNTNLEKTLKEDRFSKKTMENIIRENQQQQQIVGRSMSGSAVRNPDRTDEKATREIQRSSGLSREEYASAKATEFEIKKPTTISTLDNKLENFKYEHPERIAENLHQLKTQYINLERQTKNHSKNSNNIREQQSTIENKAVRIDESIKSIESTQQRINTLREQRSGLGVFKIKEKRQIKQQINSLEKSKQQAINNFERTFKMRIEQANGDISKLNKQSQVLQEQKEKLPDITVIREQKKAIERQYKEQKILSDVHPEKNKINDIIKEKQLSNERNSNISELTMKAQVESKLNNITLKEKHEILKTIDPSRADKIAGQIKEQNKIKER